MSVDRSQGRWEFDENGNVQYIPPEEASASTGFGSNPGGSHRSSGKSKNSDSGWHWILIVLGFCLWWPIGLVLLFTELGGKWPGDKKVQQEVNRAAAAAKNAAQQFASQHGSQTTGGHADWQNVVNEIRTAKNSAVNDLRSTRQQNAKKAKKKKSQNKDDGAAYGLGNVKLFRTIGAIMTAACGFAFVTTLIEELTYFVDWGYFLENITTPLVLTLAGLTFLGVAGGRRRKLKRFQKYMTMVGSKNAVSLEALAKSMGCSEKKVEKDLEEMLDRGFWDQGYVDAAQRLLVLGELPWEAPPAAEPEPEADAQAEDQATATLKHIRSVNDAIANPELSRKIERIEELTAKIFQLLEERPEKAGQLRSFMNYYLPQTLKILENYSKLEAQGIEGENIAEAKQKIEAMMDKVVDGYETQLDKLFADDVLDISADLKVMESMLEKDGLTVDNELKF